MSIIDAKAPDGGATLSSFRVRSTQVVGKMAGPGAVYRNPSVQVYGTDLGWTFEHAGRIVALFGDTLPYARYYCDVVEPANDDLQAFLPSSPDDLPVALDVIAKPDSPDEFSPIHLLRDGEELDLGIAKTPLTGFSDGNHAVAFFGRVAHTRCSLDPEEQTCVEAEGLACSDRVGLCEPPIPGIPIPCMAEGPSVCSLGQRCTLSPAGYCVDRTSAQYDGTDASLRFTIARDTEIAVQRSSEPNVYDSIHTFSSKKFHNPTAQTVASFSGSTQGNDYSPGARALFVWGRPGFSTEQAGRAQLYFFVHPLPLALDEADNLDFRPRYYAGVDPETNEPEWSERQADAVPLALDGRVGGDPTEPIDLPNQMTVTWLGPPIRRWLMLYGGTTSDLLGTSGEGVVMRSAEHPWGPWTPPEVLVSPGGPSEPNAPYGPGGILYHPQCVDSGALRCARTDPIRPADALLGCVEPALQLDAGRLYGVNVVDEYTRQSGDEGLDVYWNVSTWNPYGVVLMKTTIVAQGDLDSR